MPRVIGMDPGTIGLDVFGLDDGRVFLDRSWPARDALADPSLLLGVLEAAAPLDLVAGPSGYGLPLVAARDVTENDLRLAYLPDEGARVGGIMGLRRLMRALAESRVPVLLTPGVVHLASVPAHRKVNRVDMGTADKVCAAALGIADQAERRGCDERDVSFILVELGGAFTAAIAVDEGRIVDGIGGTSGPLGLTACGALDGEVAFLAGMITKQHLFEGGVATIAGASDASPEALTTPTTEAGRLAWNAYLESAAKAVAALAVAVPKPYEVILSGRLARVQSVSDELAHVLRRVVDAPIHRLTGRATVSRQAAQGAALIADGLAGGRFKPLVDALGLRDASGTVLDHLYVIRPDTARARLGLTGC
jgi:predicted butyrate kinase (DUF1464 family)